MDARGKYAAMRRARADLKALFEAAKRGDLEAMARFEEEEVRGFRDGNGRHALHFGGVSGSAETVRWIARKAPGLLDTPDEAGVTPLALAASQGLAASCEALVSLGADATRRDSNGATPLHRAAASVQPAAVVGILCDAGGCLEASTASGTPLHWAAGNDDPVAAEAGVAALLSEGASVDATDERGLTALVLAAALGNAASVARLVRSGADVGLVVSGGATVAHVCADDEEALSAILDAPDGCRAANSRDAEGRTALDLATNPACIELLRKRGGVRGGGNAPALERKEERTYIEPPAAAAATTPRAPDDAEGAARKKVEGNEAMKRGDHARAVEIYSEAVALDPTNKVLFSNRAAARLALAEGGGEGGAFKLREAALADAETCVRLDATWPKAHFRRATALAALGDYEEAAAAFWDALRLDPTNVELKAALQTCVEEGRQKHHRGD
ncbi:hypothetical protein CTAYLR_001882 [Chrysophaeum taylorii]|uniref:Uncharacterized protein n=1 Tax=Chrysophaeum taylorii TaxID=2483200 RepID=A0AAD7XIY4_9STRA|nr:hypothetical protein CTAYLR_001882 [Chrysophaeum taylorii]